MKVKCISENKSITFLWGKTIKNIYITFLPIENETINSFSKRLIDTVNRYNAQIVKCDIFGNRDKYSEFIHEIQSIEKKYVFPVTWIHSVNDNNNIITGAIIRGVSDIIPETIFLESAALGRCYEDEFFRYCFLGGIFSNEPYVKPEQNAENLFHKIEKLLNLYGMDMTNVVRTWFYNENLLNWYNEFNKVRTSFYESRGILGKILPASTGVEGKNPFFTPVISSVEAFKPKKSGCGVREILSPMQNQATSYGSSFSRAVEIFTPFERRLLISGTASIGENGQTLYWEDINKQISHTFKVVEAILNSQKMKLEHVVRCIAYVKTKEYINNFYDKLKLLNIINFPTIVSVNDICRHDLLFEIELDAVSLKK